MCYAPVAELFWGEDNFLGPDEKISMPLQMESAPDEKKIQETPLVIAGYWNFHRILVYKIIWYSFKPN